MSYINEIKLRYLFFIKLCDIFSTTEKEAEAEGTSVKRKAQAQASEK